MKNNQEINNKNSQQQMNIINQDNMINNQEINNEKSQFQVILFV